MNGSLNPFVYVPHTGTKPPEHIKARLSQLREEAAKKAAAMKRNGYH